MNLIRWVPLTIIIIFSMFAIYCVESKPNNDLQLYEKRHLLLTDSNSNPKDKENSVPSNNELLPTNLVLVSTLDGSIRGIDRFEGRVHWTLKGGPGSSLIKSNSHFETHKLYKQDPTDSLDTKQEQEDESEKIFVDTLRNVESSSMSGDEEHSVVVDRMDFDTDLHAWEDSEDGEHDGDDEDEEPEDEIYYIIEPQDGGSLYIYGDGRPLEVRKKSKFTVFTSGY
jgi:hypothetical protein